MCTIFLCLLCPIISSCSIFYSVKEIERRLRADGGFTDRQPVCFHKITEFLELEGTLKLISLHASATGRDTFHEARAPSPAQPGPYCVGRWEEMGHDL